METLVSVQPTAIARPEATLENLLQRFLEAQDVALSSRATYRRQLRQFVSWLEQSGRADRLSSLLREDILSYKEYLLQLGLSSYTVSSYLTSVRKLYEWLEAEKVYPNITKGVKGTKKAKGFRKDCLTPGQIREALEAIDRNTLEGLRDYALLNLLLRTGLRTVEVSTATLGDLRQESGSAVLWIRGKGRASKDDFVLLVEETLRPLRAYLSARGRLKETEPLFASGSRRNTGELLTTRSISRIVKERLRAVGLDDSRLTAHSLRHTAITLSIKGGASLQQAQAMARHTDPKTTLIYFHNLARIEAGAERFISF
jgi:integrase/recombinase XerC/integrase/recombinase XerD